MLPLILVDLADLILVVTLGIMFLLHLRDHEKEQIDAEEWLTEYFDDIRRQDDEDD
jgi:hypothetical protein